MTIILLETNYGNLTENWDLGFDTATSLSLEDNIKKTVNYIDYILVNVKTAIKYMDREIFVYIFGV